MREWVRAYDRCEGRLSFSEQRVAPAVLLDAFDVIGYWRAVREWQHAKDQAEQFQRKPGG